jgi:hypothetical protein
MTTPLTEGAAIVYRDNAGRRRADYVEYYDDDIKNGRAGYDLVGGGWCYADQIIHVAITAEVAAHRRGTWHS